MSLIVRSSPKLVKGQYDIVLSGALEGSTKLYRLKLTDCRSHPYCPHLIQSPNIIQYRPGARRGCISIIGGVGWTGSCSVGDGARSDEELLVGGLSGGLSGGDHGGMILPSPRPLARKVEETPPDEAVSCVDMAGASFAAASFAAASFASFAAA